MQEIRWEQKLRLEGPGGTFVSQTEAEERLATEFATVDRLAARIRVLEGEARDADHAATLNRAIRAKLERANDALSQNLIDGARREARLISDIGKQNDDITSLRETQIPCLNTIQKARYRYRQRFDEALGLKGDEPLERVIPLAIEHMMGQEAKFKEAQRVSDERASRLSAIRDAALLINAGEDQARRGTLDLVKDMATRLTSVTPILDRISAKVDSVLPGLPATYNTEGRVEALATAFEAVKVRLGLVEDAVAQVRIATTAQKPIEFPPLGFKFSLYPTPNYFGGLISGV